MSKISKWPSLKQSKVDRKAIRRFAWKKLLEGKALLNPLKFPKIKTVVQAFSLMPGPGCSKPD